MVEIILYFEMHYIFSRYNEKMSNAVLLPSVKFGLCGDKRK
jgi:hypothetical protein